MMPRHGPDDASQNWQLLERDNVGSPADGGWGSGLISVGSWFRRRFVVVRSASTIAQEMCPMGHKSVSNRVHRYDHYETRGKHLKTPYQTP